MVQGSLKKTGGGQKKQPRKAKQMKKGARTIAPKKTALVTQKTLEKKLSAKINNNIEREMSMKANAVGKLTVMKKLAETSIAEAKKNSKKGKK
ncbi:hypothetical protein BDB00DRAFT_759896 [Zychaea mexicana]|uniref:uncharacterized protein n=1 Tax=Zychaea mexicana TaxID=64656 RepID=UPI0022FE447C|nr:uncharacterized protein BDB00DRAFT_759896 [Zychaea mexicana]KAI9495599.1 hypothetical protein BDB00DRAFT_759896 [Zychaea mexicana]